MLFVQLTPSHQNSLYKKATYDKWLFYIENFIDDAIQFLE